MKRGILLLLALSASAALAAPPPSPTGRAGLAAMTVADLEKGMLRSEGAQLMLAVKANYPAEYPLLLEEILRRIKASDGSFAASHLIGAQVMRAFMKRHSPELINAPPEMLKRINARQLELIRGLARDHVALCAEYATTGFTGRTPLPQPYLSQAGALSVMFIEASKAGAGRPSETGRGTLAVQDAQAWVDAVRRIGTSQDVLDALGHAGDSPPPPQDVSCRIGVAVYAAIDALPVEQAGRIAAYFLQEGMKAQPAE
jgi:hypothetical protein